MRERLGARDLGGVRAAYDEVYRRAEYGDKQALYDLIWRRLEPVRGAPVLDIACGGGQWLADLARRGGAGCGLELSGVALERCRARLGPETPLLQGDAAALPFSSASWRAVTCLGSLEHVLELEAGIAELRRILHPEGLALVMLPNAYHSGDLWRLMWTGYGPDHHQVIDRFATCFEWRDRLEAGGLEVLHIDRYDKGKAWKRLLPFHFAYHFVYSCRVASEGALQRR